jgi:hypothetical protein
MLLQKCPFTRQTAVCVLLCFIKLILGNRYGPVKFRYLRVEFLLKTESGYLRDAEVFLLCFIKPILWNRYGPVKFRNESSFHKVFAGPCSTKAVHRNSHMVQWNEISFHKVFAGPCSTKAVHRNSVCCFVFIKPILGNRYGPGVIP